MSAIWKMEIGQRVETAGKLYEVTQFLDFGSLLGKNLESVLFEKLTISDLRPASSETDQKPDP